MKIATALLILLSASVLTEAEEVYEEPFENEENEEYEEYEEYEEVETPQEAVMLINTPDFKASIEFYSKVFVYITKDNCQFCKQLDSVFDEAFQKIQNDRTCKSSLQRSYIY